MALQQQQNAKTTNQAQAAPPAVAAPFAKQAGANVATAASPTSMDGAVQKELASNEQAAQELRSLTNAPISEPSGNYGSGELKIDRAKPADTTVHIDDRAARTIAAAVPFQTPVRVWSSPRRSALVDHFVGCIATLVRSGQHLAGCECEQQRSRRLTS